MKFSVLMSIYEKEKRDFLDECLKSIFNQTLQPTEIVIVKDGHIPETLEEVLIKYKENYPHQIIEVPLKENQGLGKALNIGLKHCSYDIVARMDTDDICLPDRFEKQIHFLMENRDIDIVGSWIDEFEYDKEVISSQRRLPITHEEICNFAKKRNPLNHMTVVFRRRSVMDVGGYLPSLWNEDYYLWVRMLVNGKRFANLPESLVLVRTGNNMISRRGGLNYFKSEVDLLKRFYAMGFINKTQLISNLIIRGLIRFVPDTLRKTLYKNLLRK